MLYKGQEGNEAKQLSLEYGRWCIECEELGLKFMTVFTMI